MAGLPIAVFPVNAVPIPVGAAMPVGAAISRPQICADEKRAADSRPYGMTGIYHIMHSMWYFFFHRKNAGRFVA